MADGNSITINKRKFPSVYDHYINDVVTNDIMEASCIYCNSRIRGKAGVSSNFLKHLRRKHVGQYKEETNVRQRRIHVHVPTTQPIASSSTTTPTSNISTEPGPSTPSTTPSSVFEIRIPQSQTATQHSSKPTHSLVSFLVTKMIVTDLLPARTVEGNGFRELLHAFDPTYVVMSQNELRYAVLPQLMKSIQDKTKASLKSTRSLILTIDWWSVDPTQCYLGFSASFFSSAWQPKTAVLACSYICGRDNFHKVPSLIDELEKTYNIQGRIYSMIVNKHSQHDSLSLLGAGCINNLEMAEADNVDIDFPLGLPHCKAFSLLLTATLDESLIKGLSPYRSVLETATQALTEIQKSTMTTETVFGRDVLAFQTDIKWILHLQLIRCMIKYKTESQEQTQDSNGLFSDDERAILEEIVTILELFEEAMNMINVKDHIPLSLCLPSYVSLQKHLGSRSSGVCAFLATTLLSALEKNFQEFASSDFYTCQAVLDPKFKLSWCCDDELMAAKYKQIVVNKILEISPRPVSQRACLSPNDLLSKSKLFSFMTSSPTTKTGASSNTTSDDSSAESELDRYLRDDHTEANPIIYWRQWAGVYPTLSKLAAKLYCIPTKPSQVSQVFSYAANQLPAEPCSWSADLEVLLFLKASMMQQEL